ncbi:nuclear transport factor 2 family protein [Dactylosporangium matsuzakiense]|uniref:nuclear transport factor 2 family protein n=1 Tax=Dactylosporangium matsuzakiense TaxID=53360 RepID=UPI0021C2C37D|nr:nuclear transport factor 2 family protein [Dactylosporangium matsuzakiense]UWZ46826.1 nuclear transport factor 2 family protein [Dactylosporangium matsuzakiense]
MNAHEETLTARQAVERVLEVGRRQDAEAFVELLADDAVIEWPYRPEGVPGRLQGRGEILAFMQRTARSLVRFDEYREIVMHETADPEVVIVEYEVLGHITTTGEPFRQTVIAVIRVRGGLVVSYRDYINPLPLMAVLAAANES